MSEEAEGSIEMPERIGPYEVMGTLGEGGAGLVLRARDPGLDREVAIKLLMDTSRSTTVRFEREAKAAAQLDHPNIARVFAFGDEDFGPYIVMELIDGRTVEEIVDEDGPLAPREALRIVRAALSGLEAAAAIGLVHRDVKPGNLMLDASGAVKIVDFGLARRIRGTSPLSSRVTAEHQVIGTPDFMSPEQAQNRALDSRSDMYSLGATLYFALTGQPPFVNDDPISTIVDHIRNEFPDVRALCPAASDGVAALIDRLCQKDPEDRFASYGELARAVDALLHSDRAAADPERTIRLRRSEGEITRQRERVRVRLLSLLLALALAVLAFTNRGLFYATQDAPPRWLLEPSVGRFERTDSDGVPVGWTLSADTGRLEVAEETDETGVVRRFASLRVSEADRASFGRPLRKPAPGQDHVTLAFRYRLRGEVRAARAELVTGGELARPLVARPMVVGESGAWSGESLYFDASGADADGLSLEIRFHCIGSPGATLDVDDVFVQAF